MCFDANSVSLNPVIVGIFWVFIIFCTSIWELHVHVHACTCNYKFYAKGSESIQKSQIQYMYMYLVLHEGWEIVTFSKLITNTGPWPCMVRGRHSWSHCYVCFFPAPTTMCLPYSKRLPFDLDSSKVQLPWTISCSLRVIQRVCVCVWVHVYVACCLYRSW